MAVLFIRPGGIGDCMNCFPAMEQLLHQLGQPEAEVWISRPLVDFVWFAATVRAIADTGLDSVGIPGLPFGAQTLAKLAGFERIYSWYGSSNPAFREACRELPITFFPALPPANGSEAAADFFLREAGLPTGALPRLPNYQHQPRHQPKARALLSHPFSGGRAKNWPLENFQAVAEQLRPAYTVDFVAGPEEELPGALRFASLAGLAAHLSQVDMYLGNDSGITHLAAACGVPTVAIFRTTNAAVWAPRGPHVRLLQEPSVSQVLAMIHSH